MAIRTAYTLAEAVGMLQSLKKAYADLVNGQAQSYRIGTREFTALDLEELSKEIEKFSNIVESLRGEGRSTRVARVVPRDL